MLQTAAEHGALVINYARVLRLNKNATGQVDAVVFEDQESGSVHTIQTRCVINATGPFCDSIRNMDEPQSDPMLSASQGVHVVLDKSFLPGETAIIVPKTSDGRVIFMIPWLDHVLIGTTDTPIETAQFEPRAVPCHRDRFSANHCRAISHQTAHESRHPERIHRDSTACSKRKRYTYLKAVARSCYRSVAIGDADYHGWQMDYGPKNG